MVHKALERFLSVENPIPSPVKNFSSPPLILSSEVGNYVVSSRLAYLEFRGHKLFMKIIPSKVTIPTEIPRVCRLAKEGVKSIGGARDFDCPLPINQE